MFKDRYDGSPGKDAALANTRQSRFEKEHSAKNAFVKKEQASLDKYSGKKPNMKAELLEFNANMQNTGAWAQGFGKKLTAGLDKVAFPVDGEGDDS
ncbi:MAG TPA: hypothetical protein VLH77_00265 [Gammaproteobacteria bacterium]|nr:hypothetical protein [Gammaproteobacteria bacterium]